MDSSIGIIIGSFAGFLTTICAIPQIVVLIKNKSAENISFLTFIILFIGQFLWIIYGFIIHNTQLIVTNIISLFLTFLVIFFGMYYSGFQEIYFFKNKINQENSQLT